MKAKLVRISLVTRVVVEDNATEQDIMELAVPKLSEALMEQPFACIDEIVDDLECPYELSVDTNEYSFTIKKVRNSFVAYSQFEPKVKKGTMNIKTGKFVGNTDCLLDLHNYRTHYLLSN